MPGSTLPSGCFLALQPKIQRWTHFRVGCAGVDTDADVSFGGWCAGSVAGGTTATLVFWSLGLRFDPLMLSSFDFRFLVGKPDWEESGAYVTGWERGLRHLRPLVNTVWLRLLLCCAVYLILSIKASSKAAIRAVARCCSLTTLLVVVVHFPVTGNPAEIFRLRRLLVVSSDMDPGTFALRSRPTELPKAKGSTVPLEF